MNRNIWNVWAILFLNCKKKSILNKQENFKNAIKFINKMLTTSLPINIYLEYIYLNYIVKKIK